MTQKNLVEYLEELMGEMDPEEYRVSPDPVSRFLDNDRRVWPVEVWMALRDGTGKVRLQVMQLRPGPGRHPLERHWVSIMLTTLTEANCTIRERPEEVITRCVVETDGEKLLAILWETDGEKLLAILWETDHRKPRGFLTGGERR